MTAPNEHVEVVAPRIAEAHLSPVASCPRDHWPPLDQGLFDRTGHLRTPFLVLDGATVRTNLRYIRASLPDVAVYYALKCNPHPVVVQAVRNSVSGFEVASLSEAEQMLGAGVEPNRLLCLHPIKSPDFLRFLHARRVDLLAADGAEELDKIAAHAPNSRIVVRVTVPNHGSRFPQTGKFGVAPEQAAHLLAAAQARGLQAYGVTIHVGSQCAKPDTWVDALRICRSVCRQAAELGAEISLVSLGGGLPAPYHGVSAPLQAIGRAIAEMKPHRFSPRGCVVTAEPGRAVVASAGTLFTTVIGLAERADGRWAYIDVGIYHGLFEGLLPAGGFPYPVSVEAPGRPTFAYRIGGPTCDSLDVPFREISLPELHVGDRIAVRCAGAYSTTLSTGFNGFTPPHVYDLGALPGRGVND